MVAASAPSEILRLIAAALTRDESPSNRVLSLLSFCGVCQRWRDVGREIPEPLCFDGSSDTGGRKVVLRPCFRKADVAQKRDAFVGASRLLTGYAELSACGDPVTDQVLLNVAAANAGRLTSLKVAGAHSVTDAGLCAVIRASPQLRHFVLEDAGAGVAGRFVPVLLQRCRQLESLHIEGAEGIDWGLLRSTGAWAAAAAGDEQQAPTAPGGQQQQQQRRRLCSGEAAPASGGSASTSTSSSTLSRAVRAAQGRSPLLAPLGAAAQAEGGGAAGAGDARAAQQQQEQQRRANRLSSSSSSNGSELTMTGMVEESDDSSSSLGAGSDATSFSVPAHATSALAAQLRNTSLVDEAGPGGSGGSQQQQQEEEGEGQLQEGARDGGAGTGRQRGAAAAPCGGAPHPQLRRLRVRAANADILQQLLELAPGLTELALDGPAFNVQAAAALCPELRRLGYLVSSPAELDAVLFSLGGMPSLRALELEVKGTVLSTEQLRVIGMLPLRELALDSHAYRQHPSMPRPQYSHLDNEGVKGLVDSICSRMRTELMPLKLSLCGATALKQEAVSALLRLPILASIDTGGCVKLTPMDRMRLVAKVKAGQGMLDARGGVAAPGGGGGGARGGLGALRLPHVL